MLIFQHLLWAVNKGKNFPSFQMLSTCWVIGNISMRSAASCAAVPMKHRAVNTSILLKNTVVTLVLSTLLLVHPAPRESQWGLMSYLAVPSFFVFEAEFSANGLHCLLHASCRFLLGLFFTPKDGGNMFLQNTDWPSAEYTALYRVR
jgi:hypothetical protein